MKFAGILILAVLLMAVLISGCVQQPSGPSTTGGLTQKQAEDQAFDAMDDEMNALEGMSLEDLENELLQQG